MPEPLAVRLARRLRLVARVLPGEVRERVFEPALADLLLDHAERGAGQAQSSRRLTLAGLVLVLEAFRIGLPAYLWRAGSPTRAGRVVVALLMVGAMLLVLVRSVSYPVPVEGPLSQVGQIP